MASGLAGLVDEALLAARSWIASEMFLDVKVLDACTWVRLAPDLEDGLRGAVEACCALSGMDGGVLFLRDRGVLQVAAAHGLPRAAVSAFDGFGSLGSVLLPGGNEPDYRELADCAGAADDFLVLALREQGYRVHIGVPIALDGRAGDAVICLVARTVPGDRKDTRRRLHRAAAGIADSIERRRATDEIARREASLRAIVDSVGDGILTIDGDGIVLSANPAAGQVFGCTADEIVGLSLSGLFRTPGGEGLLAGLGRYAAGEGAWIVGRPTEVPIVARNGRETTVEVIASEIEPRRLLALVIRDVTERRKAEAQLRQSDRMSSLGALAAGLGHDMNNVLFPLRAHLNALATDAVAASPAARGEAIEQVSRGLAYLQQLADGLHYLVNDAGHADGGTDGAMLADWWRGTGPLPSRGLPPLTEVVAEIAPGLPRVRATEHALTQAVLNLFVNAGDAIASVEGGPRGRIRIAAHAAPDGRSVLLSVSDNGPGMSDDTRRRAFDMFFTTKVRGMGTGLGLAMVARIAREAGGDASIESRPGEGATVTLRLPVAADADALDGALAAVSCADGRAAAFIESALRGRGLRIATAGANAEADAWFVDPRAADPRAARAWRLRREGRTVVLLGRPHRMQRKAWQSAADCTIESITDFDTLLAGVGRACSIIQRRWKDVGHRNGGGPAGCGRPGTCKEEGDQPVDGHRAGGGARALGG